MFSVLPRVMVFWAAVLVVGNDVELKVMLPAPAEADAASPHFSQADC
jgi:hypothetical protein